MQISAQPVWPRSHATQAHSPETYTGMDKLSGTPVTGQMQEPRGGSDCDTPCPFSFLATQTRAAAEEQKTVSNEHS